jgi:RNA polymerase sigma factor (sigma-70 family)
VEELDYALTRLSTSSDGQELFENYKSMAVSTAGYYARKCSPFISFDDFRQWGLIGLWDACCRFTGPREEFRFYAKSRIRGQILDGIRNWVPQRRQRTKSGVMPKFTELDYHTMASTDPPLDEVVHARIELKKILESLDLLTERELYIISSYCFEDQPLREIAKQLGLTEARVSQLKDMALNKMVSASSAALDPR